MKAISLVQTPDRTINQLQQNISQSVNPIINNPLVDGNILLSQNLISGTNVLNHGLGRPLQGWSIIGINGAAQIYDAQSTNPNPQATLILISNAAVTINLYCF